MGVGDDDTMVNRPCSFTMGSRREKNKALFIPGQARVRENITRNQRSDATVIYERNASIYAYKSKDVP